MKKAFALVLTLALIATLSVASFAAVTALPDSSNVKDLTVTYTALTENNDTVYSVDVEWTDLVLAYTAGSESAWDPETHTYEVTGAKWTDANAAVKVTNHSNAAVVADVEVTAEEGFTVTDDQATAVTLAAGEVGKPTEAKNATFTLTVAGTPTENNQKVASVTVKLTAAE